MSVESDRAWRAPVDLRRRGLRFRPRAAAEVAPLGRRGLMAAIAASLIVPPRAFAAAPPVGSEDYEMLSPFAEWISEQRDSGWRPCCDVADGRIVDVRVRDGRFEVLFLHPETLPEGRDRDGLIWRRPVGWQSVPDAAIIKDADGKPVHNPTGIPVAWWYLDVVRCFAMAGEI